MEISQEHLQVLQAKAAAFDAIQQQKELARQLAASNNTLSTTNAMLTEMSDYMCGRAEHNAGARELVKKYNLTPST